MSAVVIARVGVTRPLTLASIVSGSGSEGRRIAGVWWVTFTLAALVYVAVAALIVYALTRGRRVGATPSQLREDAFIWIGGIALPVLILFVLAVMTVHTTEALRRPSHRALRVEVTGKDWWWAVRYPQQRFETANEIHLPAGRPVDIRLTSDNVIHSFWVPELAGKMDVVPGQTNHLRFTPEKPGVYSARCAEYCGIQHAHMAMRVIVESPGDYGRWEARRTAPRNEPTSQDAATGAVVFQREACAGCHTVRGTSADGTVGPDLTDFGQRQTIGSSLLENTPRNLEAWIHDAPSLKPGIVMPSFRTLSSRDVRAIVAYLESLK